MYESPVQGGEDDAFLWLDHNHNSFVDNGSELGFEKLATYDTRERGGNRDGFITAADLIWSTLMLWADENHNGESENDEIAQLIQTNVIRIDLSYVVNGKKDEHGNQFRYKSRIFRIDATGKEKSSHMYDVIFVRSN